MRLEKEHSAGDRRQQRDRAGGELPLPPRGRAAAADRSQGTMDTAQPDDLYVPGDLNDEAFVAALAERAADTLGSVDVVVLNHGLQASGPLTKMAYDDARMCSTATCSARSW